MGEVICLSRSLAILRGEECERGEKEGIVIGRIPIERSERTVKAKLPDRELTYDVRGGENEG
ncbi:hypothetical protein [Metallosphaera hakonensis]|uniref:Uncharacterized protein n=1 Tax=Metallosphaera hakonensis JCM 8857 = DSM 7519 TaxID=1293036 RepID=A0A2U9IRQ2_9CREN|nr:hypothetical protein [Metallosphaera hakonensis]AWR98663.1 hypothetical protein DFR87_01925 [Metallosphaera hakonensis JCM 8857 = DSM 7519]